MARRNKHVQVLVTADKVAMVNKVMLRNGYGPNYLNIDIENASGTLTHSATETLADDPEYAAIGLALKKVPKTKKTVVKKRVVGRHKKPHDLDDLLKKKKLKRKPKSKPTKKKIIKKKRGHAGGP